MAEGADRVEDPRAGDHIVAMVLSHNAPQSLNRCLAAIGAQKTRPAEVVVIDSASDPPIDAASLPPAGAPVRVVRSDTNIGPAGGWALGLRDFLAGDHQLAWLMDDDIVPEPDCLHTLATAAEESDTLSLWVPVSMQPDGSVGTYGSWCGILIDRRIVEAVGLPMEELFWWAEDTEYCHWRIPKAGFPRRVLEDAVVRHDCIRQGGDVPSWKYYYEARNMLWYHLHIMRRVGRYPRNVAMLIGRAIFKQRTHRLECFRAIVKGLYDGARGRLGLRYPIGDLAERNL
jgi:GT2 family glycosyltransferase